MPTFASLVSQRAAVLMVLLALCAGNKAPAQGTLQGTVTQPAFHEVVDEVGRTVRVPVSPARIVSLAPSLTETVYALGLQDRLVGDTDYCDYPPEAQKKPKVGGVINPNLEQIAALHPDLVLVTRSINRLDTVRALDTLGIPSYATDPHSVSEILSSTQRLADMLNSTAAGKSVTEDLQRRLDTLQAKLNSAPARRVLFIVWTEPLISVGKDTFIADALRRAGAISIVDSTQSWPQMNLEEVARLQPEYLVFASAHSDSVSNDLDALAARPGWRILDAVRNRRFAVVSEAVNRPAPRIVTAIEDLAHQLHPAAFAEPSPGRDVPPAHPGSPELQPKRARDKSAALLPTGGCPCAR